MQLTTLLIHSSQFKLTYCGLQTQVETTFI